MTTSFIHCLVVFGCIALMQTPLHAQLNWSPITEESNLTFQWVKPSFDGDAEYSILSGNYYLGGRWFAKPGFFILAEIPFVTYSYELNRGIFGSSKAYGTTFGNPYLGIEAGSADRFFIAEVGLRIPAVDTRSIDDNRRSIALTGGVYADIERFSAYIDDYIPIRLTLNVQPWLNEGTTRLRFKFGVWNYIPHEEHSENESILHWGFWLTHNEGNLHVGGGYVADFVVDEDLEFDEAVIHQLALSFGMTFHKTTPGITIRLPLNENLSRSLNYAFMLTCSYSLE